MSAEINGIPLAHRKGLWFAEVPSKSYGTLEAVLDGSKDAPDALQAEASAASPRTSTKTSTSSAAASSCRSSSSPSASPNKQRQSRRAVQEHL